MHVVLMPAMARPLLLAFLGLSLVAGCTVGDTGGGGGGGNGDPDAGSAGGDAAGDDAPGVVPRLEVSIDKPTLATELMTTNMLTVTLTSADGFSGPVALTATVVDAQGQPLDAWPVTLSASSLNVGANSTASSVATVIIPSENRGLAGTVKIEATSSAGTQSVTSAVTALNQITFGVTLNNGQCEYPTAGDTNITFGTMIRFLNKANDNITIHVDDGGPYGVPHQPDPGSAPNTAYEKVVTEPTQTPTLQQFSWYCHQPGPNVGKTRVLKPVPAR
jgi:hypothetical protein